MLDEKIKRVLGKGMKILEKIKKEYYKTTIIVSIVFVGGFAGLFLMQINSESKQPIYAETTETADTIETKEIEQYIEDGVITNPDDILALVNGNRRLPDGFVPQDLVIPDVLFSFSGEHEQSHMRLEAAEALEELFTLALQDGIELIAVSGYRSFERQDAIFNRNVEQRGFEDASQFSAQAGHSEHQTGLAMDVTSRSVNLQITQELSNTEEGQWLAENAHRAGFIIRYLEGKEHITGFSYEPWHIRYVGDSAEEIFERRITLEEYLGIME